MRTQEQILANYTKITRVEELLSDLEKYDTVNEHWYEEVGEDVNGKFLKYASELHDGHGNLFDKNRIHQIRMQRKTLLEIRKMIGFNEYHPHEQRDRIVSLFGIYRRFGESYEKIAELTNRKISYFRSAYFKQSDYPSSVQFTKENLVDLNEKLKLAFI